MEYTIQDIIDATVEQEPTKVQAAFDHLIGQRVMTALEARKREIAANMFNHADESEQEYDTDNETEIGASDAESQDTQSA